MKKAVFGGGFDPPHNGHVMLANAVIDGGFADLVIFVPTYCPPHKSSMPEASFAHRLAMLRLVARKFPSFVVSDIEYRLGRSPSYSFYTMMALEEENPNDELFFLLGSDSLRDLHLWHRAEELVQRWRIITYLRPHFEISREYLLSYWSVELVNRFEEGIISLGNLSSLASSQIRYNIRLSGDYRGLPEEIVDFILKEKLYKEVKDGEKSSSRSEEIG